MIKNYFTNKTLLSKILMAFVLISVILIFKSTYTLYSLNKVTQSLMSVNNSNIEVEKFSTQIIMPLASIRMLSMELVLSPNKSLITKINIELDSKINKLNSSIVDWNKNDLKNNDFDEIKIAWLEYKTDLQKTKHYALSSTRIAAFINVTNEEKNSYEKLLKQIRSFYHSQLEKDKKIFEQASVNSTYTLFTVIASVLIVLTLLIIVIRFVFKAVKGYVEDKQLYEKEIEEITERLTLTIAGSGDGLWEINHINNTLWWSPQLKEMLGYEDDEIQMTPEKGFDYLHPDDIELSFSAFTNHLENDAVYDIIFRMIHKDSSSLWLRARAKTLRDENGKPLKTSGTVSDISEQKRLESEIKLSEKRFRTLFDASPDSVLILKDGKHTDCNTSALKMFGLENRESVIGTTPLDYSPQYQDSGELSALTVKEKVDEVISIGSSRFEWKHKRFDNNECFDAEIILTSMDLLGEAYIYAVVRDISARKKSELEIKQLHKNTRDSIEYASLIQSALIPNNDLFEKYFSDYFTIWQPKDIIGGDIYLFEELRNENECLLMVIDCTGHGVPGAFVTMLVKAIERQVISKIENDKSIDVSPAWILSYFNKTMKKLLQQESDDSVSNAGFDGGIIYYNKKENIIKFSGAETPLFYIEDNELKTIKGNRHSIGYKKSDINYEFKDHIINVKDGMKFYLSTDGYFDQNGGEKSFPFGKSKFTTVLLENHKEQFIDQKEILLDTLQGYQQKEDKNDDVTIFGFEIQKDLQFSKETIIEYDGVLTQGIIAHTMEIIEKEILNISMMGKVSTTVIELLQNMMHYGKGDGFYKLIKNEDDYEIKTKNSILLEDKNKIEKKLLEIKSLDEAGIKKRYRELRRSGENTHGKGGGIGLYEIAKLVKDIEYGFTRIDDNTYSYEFIAKIVSKKS